MYYAVALVAVVLASLLAATALDRDVGQTISIGLIVTGAAVGLLGALGAAGPPPPDVPGMEREYLRHVHHRDAASRKAWQSDSLLLVLAGVGLAGAGALVELL